MSDLGGGLSEVGVRLVVDGQTLFSSELRAAAASIESVKQAAADWGVSTGAVNKALSEHASQMAGLRTGAKAAAKEYNDLKSPIEDFASTAKSAFSGVTSSVGDFTSGLESIVNKAQNLGSVQFLNYNAWGL